MKQKFSEFFPYGCQYHRAPTPLPDEWEGDLKEIARQGYTHVQFRPQWRCHERIRGEFVWNDLDRLFELAEKNGLGVILKAQLENAPDWVFCELGGSRVGFHGKPLDPIAHAAFYVGGWWPCYDNPAVAEAAENFTRKLAERYKNHPALWFYNAWNEPRSRPLGQCQCEHSAASYRNWLKRRFGTIEELNSAYGKAWTSFETVRPPHSYSDYVELFLWRQWAGEAVAEQVALSARGFRKADASHPVMCHVGCSSLVQDPACDTSNDLLNSAEVDWYGCSFPIELYPKNLMERNMPLFQSAWLRRVDENYWCQEFYTNYANWCKEPDAGFIEQAIWMAIASGCRGLTFWQYRSERFGEESNGWGMRNIDGTPTARSQSCDRAAKVLKTLGKEFAASSPRRAQAALWFDIRNDLLMRIQTMQSGLDSIEDVRARTDYPAKNAVAGAHVMLRTLGVTADFVIAGDELSGYKLLVVNAVELIDPAAAAWLTRYVENGGVLLIEYPFACRDERTWVTAKRPSNGLEHLTGCREASRLAMAEHATETIRFSDGVLQSASGCRVVLEPISTECEIIGCWNDGAPAVTRHRFGKGEAIVCGGNFGMAAFDDSGNPSCAEIYRRALASAGIARNESSIWTFSRYTEATEYRFYFNIGESKVVTLGSDETTLHLSPGCTETESGFEIVSTGTIITKRPI